MCCWFWLFSETVDLRLCLLFYWFDLSLLICLCWITDFNLPIDWLVCVWLLLFCIACYWFGWLLCIYLCGLFVNSLFERWFCWLYLNFADLLFLRLFLVWLHLLIFCFDVYVCVDIYYFVCWFGCLFDKTFYCSF